MGLERKTGAGISTQAWQPYLGGESGSFGEEGREGQVALVEKGERTTWLWQSGDPVAATQLMVPGA